MRLVPLNDVLARVMVVRTGVGGGGGAPVNVIVIVSDVKDPQVPVYITVAAVDLLMLKVCDPYASVVEVADDPSFPLKVTLAPGNGAPI